jgi:hypothetical protein
VLLFFGLVVGLPVVAGLVAAFPVRALVPALDKTARGGFLNRRSVLSFRH